MSAAFWMLTVIVVLIFSTLFSILFGSLVRAGQEKERDEHENI